MNDYHKSPLPIGTKVVRGPTWMWGDQDKSGVGTVIPKTIHTLSDFTLTVRWADGAINSYRYTGRFKDVTPVKSEKTFKELL